MNVRTIVRIILVSMAVLMLTGCVSTNKEYGIEGNRIRLEDSIEINAPLDELYAWMLDLEKNFVPWHPNHEYFIKLTGGFEPGDQIRFKELVMGEAYDIEGTIIEHWKNDHEFYMMFETFSGMGKISFNGKSTPNGCIFIHIEEFGKPAGFCNSIYNWWVFEVFGKKKANWELILTDMKEDNINLKQILETGIYPERKNANG